MKSIIFFTLFFCTLIVSTNNDVTIINSIYDVFEDITNKFSKDTPYHVDNGFRFSFDIDKEGQTGIVTVSSSNLSPPYILMCLQPQQNVSNLEDYGILMEICYLDENVPFQKEYSCVSQNIFAYGIPWKECLFAQRKSKMKFLIKFTPPKKRSSHKLIIDGFIIPEEIQFSRSIQDGSFQCQLYSPRHPNLEIHEDISFGIPNTCAEQNTCQFSTFSCEVKRMNLKSDFSIWSGSTEEKGQMTTPSVGFSTDGPVGEKGQITTPSTGVSTDEIANLVFWRTWGIVLSFLFAFLLIIVILFCIRCKAYKLIIKRTGSYTQENGTKDCENKVPLVEKKTSDSPKSENPGGQVGDEIDCVITLDGTEEPDPMSESVPASPTPV